MNPNILLTIIHDVWFVIGGIWLFFSGIWGFLAGLVALVVFLFVHNKLSPALKLRLRGDWIDEERIILGIEIENVSGVRVMPEYIKLQILEYPAGTLHLSEWVPFASDQIHAGEDPISWRDPIKILKTTQCANPGDTFTIERIETLSSKGLLLHVGLQFKSKSSIWLLRFRHFGHGEQWTTTAIFSRPRVT